MKRRPTAIFGILAALVLVFAVSAPSRVISSNSPITGWAWSNTIGWVSFNCSNIDGAGCSSYGLSANGTGNISGYAWGSGIGWISAEQDANVCGEHARIDNDGNFTGWLLALSLWPGGGSTVGCISLSGTGYQATTNSNPNYTTYTDAAWGSDTIGWLVFNAAGGQCIPTFTCVNNVSTNSCTGAEQICQNGCDPTGACNPGPTLIGCISVNSATCSPPQKSLRVAKGTAVTLYWQVINVSSCAITGTNGQQWANQAVTGTVTTAGITAATKFTLSCDGGAFTDQLTVSVVPVFKEI